MMKICTTFSSVIVMMMVLVDPIHSFSLQRPSFLSNQQSNIINTKLYAESGAPQYQKQMAILRQAEVLGEGSVMLHIDRVDQVDDDDNNNNAPLDYQPGHVLALEIQGNPDDKEIDEKTVKDMKNNDGWMRGPYTVTRCYDDKSIDILIKVVGYKSKTLANAAPGTPLRFGGKFKVPIAEGIAPNTKRIVLLSTGVGIGPCTGAIEKLLLSDNNKFDGSIDLFASFRKESEMVLADYLKEMSTTHTNFRYQPIITSQMGRLSASEENIRQVINKDICPVNETHYHLIGNGQMVSEWKAGLEKAGVVDTRITIENYFNHQAKPSAETIERIATVINAAALVPVEN